MKILFYDINLLNQKKYIGDLINEIINNSKNNVYIMYDEFVEEGEEYFKNKNCILIKNKSITYKGIKNNLIHINPDILIVNAQRLSDTAYVSIAKQMGIKTVMIQHGMYIPFMKRERFFFIKKIFKTLKFYMYSQSIAKSIDDNGFKVFKCFFQTFIKGRIYKEVIDFTKLINVDYVLVYGNYWKNYHHDIFGYDFNQQITIGYHELNRVDKIKKLKFETESVCYIAQTLVEDGRFKRSEMEDFIVTLHQLTEKKTVYIKLHPRSDRSLYENKGFTLLENDIPNTELYIGHYSSMIALLGHLKGDLILYEFKDHKIPNYFKKISTVVDSREELLKKSNKKSIDKDNINTINEYFSKSYDTTKTIHLIESLHKR